MPFADTSKQPRRWYPLVLLATTFLLLAMALTGSSVLAEDEAPPEETPVAPTGSPLHPPFPLLDEAGENVLTSGEPVSTMNTCGACHDAAFIEKHSYHAQAGFDDRGPAGETPTERAWDTSPGFFGTWNPIAYRYLSPPGDEYADLTTPEWIQLFGSRHPGGGPMVYSQSGEKLTELAYSPTSFETNIVDPETGELVAWDWAESGVVEMNCFLCHTPNPNNEARKAALHDGQFKWANTATLLGSGIVAETAGEFSWNEAAFDENGELQTDFIQLQGPQDTNCGLCHGLVHDNVEDPLVLNGCSPERWTTITTGQIIASQRLSDSGMNLADKESLSRSWDTHAERQLACTNCHYAINNPLYYHEGSATRPEHLIFDPRRLSIGDYLEKPLHQFARGDSAQSMVSPNVKDTMRDCDDCHTQNGNTHEWLPYRDRHMDALSCESCHIPKLYSSANQQYDWTVLDIDGNAQRQCRGTEGEGGVNTLLTGYEPVLLPRQAANGSITLVPHNLITTWFWVYGEDERPVPQRDLARVYLQEGDYAPEVLAAFDANANGQLDEGELLLDTEAKKTLIAERLRALGLENPRVTGEIQPYSIHHDVATSEWATSDCQTCHSENTRLTQAIRLSGYTPVGAEAAFMPGSNVIFDGEVYTDESGALYYQPALEADNLYILGSDNVKWVDAIGIWSFIAVVLGVLAHGGLRVYAAYKNPPPETKTKRVYMYSVYERFWHWLQTTAIVLLLFTGIIIHNPDSFILFSFSGVVITHNVLAAILAINAALSLFYHMASGEIKQYIPRPRGFFDQTFTQATYYLRGIFTGAEHPFEKTTRKKLNPLQQITYFGILNVLLPLQGITGILIWGAQRFPELTASLGGLPFLAPFHTLIAWLFGAFIVLHVYLTTTGHTPLAGIESMIMGWDEVEVHDQD